MRILFLGNNWVGWQALTWLKQQGENIVGLVVHPPNKQKFGEEIIQTADLPAKKVFDGSQLRDPQVLDSIHALSPDIGISVLFGYILRPTFLDLFRNGCINLHPAYLPYNRGAYPNVWSIVDGTPAGTTLHYIDKGIDTGAIIAQRQVTVAPIDTGETLYKKLEMASLELFQETWPLIRQGQVNTIRQLNSEGTYHATKDVAAIDAIDLDKQYTARELLNILRARTFPPYPGAYFEVDGRKVYLQLALRYGESEEN